MDIATRNDNPLRPEPLIHPGSIRGIYVDPHQVFFAAYGQAFPSSDADDLTSLTLLTESLKLVIDGRPRSRQRFPSSIYATNFLEKRPFNVGIFV